MKSPFLSWSSSLLVLALAGGCGGGAGDDAGGGGSQSGGAGSGSGPSGGSGAGGDASGAKSGSGGGSPASGGNSGAGGSPGGQGGDTGGSAGGGAAGGQGGEAGSGGLDLDRVARARKIQRRFSLGHSEMDICLVKPDGSVYCTIAGELKKSFDPPADLVTQGGLGYCVIQDDQAVYCDPSSGDTEESRAFEASVTSAEQLFKTGNALGVIGVGGGIRYWGGSTYGEQTAEAPSGSYWGGEDAELCYLGPDGFIRCFYQNPLVDDSLIVDKSEFELETKRYVALDQGLGLFAAIDTEGVLMVRSFLEDTAITYRELQVQVAATMDYWCMVSNTGTLRCDTYDVSDAPAGFDQVPSGEFLAVDVNETFACAVRVTGELEGWGEGIPSLPSNLVRLD